MNRKASLLFNPFGVLTSAVLVLLSWNMLEAGTKHSGKSQFSSYSDRVMTGYQGWFRAEGDGSGRGWVHYGNDGKFDPINNTIDFWPDVSEYPKTYPTPFSMPDGSQARVFSSWDESTVDVHFRWMREYGVDGAFMQRFFGVTRTPESRANGRVILGHALKASQRHGRAIAVMYDLSGLKAEGEDCSSVIQDWKELVDKMKITSRGDNQTYLYHRGKPLLAIWGLGFPDRPYNIRTIGFEELLDFLQNDPEYGGCSIMLGVPAYFRRLAIDTNPDPYLHELMRRADIIMPWNPHRYTPLLQVEMERFSQNVRDDQAWCAQYGLDYAPCVYPGFSWYNLSRLRFGGRHPLNQIPRQKGRFYWGLIEGSVRAGAKMLYVAMFDEVDEGTAIFKCATQPPRPAAPSQFVGFDEGVPNDHYLWLTGQGGQLLRGEIPLSPDHYLRLDPDTRNR
jgi:hypothetical protein